MVQITGCIFRRNASESEGDCGEKQPFVSVQVRHPGKIQKGRLEFQTTLNNFVATYVIRFKEAGDREKPGQAPWRGELPELLWQPGDRPTLVPGRR